MVQERGVHLVGSNDLRRRCSELSKKADGYYNNMMLTSQHVGNGVSDAKETVVDAEAKGISNDAQDAPAIRVRRKHKFVNWLMTGHNPPLQANSKFPVSEEEIIHYSAIVELANSPHAK